VGDTKRVEQMTMDDSQETICDREIRYKALLLEIMSSREFRNSEMSNV
jgi:hypothetical protein